MIYFLEDDDSIRKLVIYGLESQGFEAEGFSLPSAFWRAMEQKAAELVLLDIMLPEEDGLQILKKLRAAPETRRLPVILLTAKNSEFDRVIGLDNGADDFISKPFSMLELIARIRAVLRRSQPAQSVREYRLGPLYVCPEQHIVRVDGQDVTLTNKEFELLLFLLRHPNQVFSREDLYEMIWGLESMGDNITVAVHINRLREKIEKDPSAPEYIQTVWGVGYRLKIV